jgi:hypothetical protein
MTTFGEGFEVSHETCIRALLVLREATPDSAGRVSMSCRALAGRLCVGRQTALKALRALTAAGAIEVARKGTGHQYPTVYRLREDA